MLQFKFSLFKVLTIARFMFLSNDVITRPSINVNVIKRKLEKNAVYTITQRSHIKLP